VCPCLKLSVASICDRRRQLPVPHVCRGTFWSRAFSVAGPIIWISLPGDLWDTAVDSEYFLRNLKTLLFTGHYGALVRWRCFALSRSTNRHLLAYAEARWRYGL